MMNIPDSTDEVLEEMIMSMLEMCPFTIFFHSSEPIILMRFM